MSCSRAGSDDAAFRCRRNPTAAAPTGDPPAPSANACTSEPVPPYQCTPCIAQGGDCRGTGRNNSCCGGFCMAGAPGAMIGEVGALASSAGIGGSVFSGFCSNGNNGLQCGTDAECFSGICADLTGSNAGGVCVGGVDGSPCDDDEDCTTGRVCVEKTGIHVCVTPTYYSPCESSEDCTGGLSCHNYRCGGNMTQSCSSDADCTTLMGGLAAFGPMQCWTQEDHDICKPFKTGTVCNVGGQVECGNATINVPGTGTTRTVQNVCCDRCLTDRAIFSASAGICVTPGPGSGCDNSSECQRYDSASLCRPIELYGLNVFHCSYGGTEGMPCVGGGSTNTCQSGLTCPATVFRCVRPPGCPAS
jgi:hypothetical protein